MVSFNRSKFLASMVFVTIFLTLSTLVTGRRLRGGSDPTIMKYGASYISADSDGSAIWIHQADSIEGLGAAEGKKIWSVDTAATKGLSDVWAPEIIRRDNITYIYFSAGEDNNHHMYYIEAGQPMSDYSQETKLDLPEDKWAIDGTLVAFESDLYFVWSGWESTGGGDQSLYICRMDSPTQAVGERHIISQPREIWERHDHPLINEGPQAIIDPDGNLHILYSCNGSWDERYCIADLRLRSGGDPTRAYDWYKSNGCLFGSNHEDLMPGWDRTVHVKGPGHHTFALPDGNALGSPDMALYIPFVFHGVDVQEKQYKWELRALYTGGFVWWANTTYFREACPACSKRLSSIGFSLKFFEDR